jgi:hypothetical protein
MSKPRTFKHHETGRTIIRELNIPTHMIPEYRLPPSKEDEKLLAAIITYCLQAQTKE